MEKSSKLDMVQ